MTDKQMQEPEPACWQGEDGCPNRQACCDAQHCLYTTPLAQRQWVGTVDCIGLALDLEAQAKRVESQTVQRTMLAAANGLRIIDKESKT